MPTIFDQNKEEQKIENYKDILVGEEKKYKSDEELAKGYYNADKRLQEIQEENAKLREQIESANNISKATEELKQKDEVKQKATPTAPVKDLSEIDFDAVIDERLARKEKEKFYEQNLLSVNDKLIAKFGDKAEEEMTVKAKELGLTVKEFAEMAARSPASVLIHFGETATKTTSSTFNNEVNIEGQENFNDASVKGKSYYRKLMLENPKLFYNAKTQQEMYASMNKLGNDYSKY